MTSPQKYILYAYIKPYDMKLCLALPIDAKIRFIQEYIEDTMRNFRSRYKVGRIEHKKTSAILLPDFKIGETLENKDELIVYSIEYGLTKKSLNDKKYIEDIDKLFIQKKTKRESKGNSRKISIDASEKNLKENKSYNSDENEEQSEEKEDNNEEENEKKGNDNKKEEKKNKNDNYEDNNSEGSKKNDNNKKKKIKKIVKKELSSESGEDTSEDLKL